MCIGSAPAFLPSFRRSSLWLLCLLVFLFSSPLRHLRVQIEFSKKRRLPSLARMGGPLYPVSHSSAGFIAAFSPFLFFRSPTPSSFSIVPIPRPIESGGNTSSPRRTTIVLKCSPLLLFSFLGLYHISFHFSPPLLCVLMYSRTAVGRRVVWWYIRAYSRKISPFFLSIPPSARDK